MSTIFILVMKMIRKLSVTDLLVSFTSYPTSCEGLDGDGCQTHYLVDLPQAVASPVSLYHQCCPALLQCRSSHCFTEGLQTK